MMVMIIAVQIIAATRARPDSRSTRNELEQDAHSGGQRGMEKRTSFGL